MYNVHKKFDCTKFTGKKIGTKGIGLCMYYKYAYCCLSFYLWSFVKGMDKEIGHNHWIIKLLQEYDYLLFIHCFLCSQSHPVQLNVSKHFAKQTTSGIIYVPYLCSHWIHGCLQCEMPSLLGSPPMYRLSGLD